MSILLCLLLFEDSKIHLRYLKGDLSTTWLPTYIDHPRAQASRNDPVTVRKTIAPILSCYAVVRFGGALPLALEDGTTLSPSGKGLPPILSCDAVVRFGGALPPALEDGMLAEDSIRVGRLGQSGM